MCGISEKTLVKRMYLKFGQKATNHKHPHHLDSSNTDLEWFRLIDVRFININSSLPPPRMLKPAVSCSQATPQSPDANKCGGIGRSRDVKSQKLGDSSQFWNALVETKGSLEINGPLPTRPSLARQSFLQKVENPYVKGPVRMPQNPASQRIARTSKTLDLQSPRQTRQSRDKQNFALKAWIRG